MWAESEAALTVARRSSGGVRCAPGLWAGGSVEKLRARAGLAGEAAGRGLCAARPLSGVRSG